MATLIPLRNYPFSNKFIAFLTFFPLCFGWFLGFTFSFISIHFFSLIFKTNPLPFDDEEEKAVVFISGRNFSSASAPTTGDLQLLSDTEFGDDNFTTTEESEVEWPFFHRSDDGSISDEESLIEIALPTGHYVSHRFDEEEEDDDMSFQLQKMSDFQQQRKKFVELLAEINAEENLIEIDISMGSIKYSRFEIEA